jgi:ABC-type polar amino acid transport system ATPase subunit
MLQATGLQKSFGRNAILAGVDVSVEPGTITAVIGPSGGGKSTLVRALSLLEPPDAGTIVIDDVRHAFPRSRHGDAEMPWPTVTVVFQQLFLWPHLTLRQNVMLPLELRRTAAAARANVDDLLRCFEITEIADKFPNETSLGQRQRAALIRALVLEPKYLLLDEVTSALDVEHVGRVLQQLQVARERGTGILLVTHLIGFARQSADQVVFIEGGRVVEAGGPSLLMKPESARLSRFLSLVETAA